MNITAVVLAVTFIGLALWAGLMSNAKPATRLLMVAVFSIVASVSICSGFHNRLGGWLSTYSGAVYSMWNDFRHDPKGSQKEVAKVETPTPKPDPAPIIIPPDPPKTEVVPPPAPVVVVKEDELPKATPAPKSRSIKVVAKKPVEHRAGVFKWEHFGVDPFAKSRDDAMARRERFFREAGFSQACMAEAMRVTSTPGISGVLSRGDMLDGSESGSGIHFNVEVFFPEGIQATTEDWSLTCDGKSMELRLPRICFNWSFHFGRTQRLTPPLDRCVELSLNAPIGGEVRWGVGSSIGPLPPSACNAQKQDDDAWQAWWGECDICRPALGYIRGLLGGTAEIYQKYLYRVTAKRQTLRFSTEIWTRLVYICLEDAQGRQSCGVYMRPQDWQGRYKVELADELWRFDGGCPRE